MSLSRKRWSVPAPPPPEEAAALAEELGILPAVARILMNRGLKSAGAAGAFLHPSPEQLHSPWLMQGMEQAVTRILAALEKGENIVVHGDYDADGITAAALMVEALRQLGARTVDYYLPSRFREGYGLHREALERIAGEGADLVITVDCGMNAAAEVNFARGLGLEPVSYTHLDVYKRQLLLRPELPVVGLLPVAPLSADQAVLVHWQYEPPPVGSPAVVCWPALEPRAHLL